MSTRGRGGGGLDYYTLTYNYDDDDEKYEEDSIPGMGSGGSPSSGIFVHLLLTGNFSLFHIKPKISKFFYTRLYWNKS